VTYVDTISLAVIMIGSSLAIALAFGATLLSAKWWKIITIKRDNKGRKIVMQLLEEQVEMLVEIKRQQQNQSDVSKELTTSSHVVKSKTQTLAQLKRTSNWNELINRRIKTCELIDIGHVIAVDSQSMTILHENADQEYVIPTYYIREYDQQKVLIDISIRDLDHYIIEGKLRPHIQK
jgi:hypothetical protein